MFRNMQSFQDKFHGTYEKCQLIDGTYVKIDTVSNP